MCKQSSWLVKYYYRGLSCRASDRSHKCINSLHFFSSYFFIFSVKYQEAEWGNELAGEIYRDSAHKSTRFRSEPIFYSASRVPTASSVSVCTSFAPSNHSRTIHNRGNIIREARKQSLVSFAAIGCTYATVYKSSVKIPRITTASHVCRMSSSPSRTKMQRQSAILIARRNNKQSPPLAIKINRRKISLCLLSLKKQFNFLFSSFMRIKCVKM